MPPDDRPDAVLATEAQNGNRRAFDELVTRHKSVIYRIARHYIGDSDDAYDILQQTFLGAWLALKSYDPGREFGAWLRTIALNKCRDFGRRRAVRQKVLRLFSLLDVREKTVPSADVTAELEAGENDRLRALNAAIAALPEKYKVPLILTAVAGLSQQDVASQLKTTTKAVEMRVRRARQRLELDMAKRMREDV